MARSLYWADNYIERQHTPESAIALIKPGQRVFIGSCTGEPQALLRVLTEVAGNLSGVEIIRLMSQESVLLSDIANLSHDFNLTIRNMYVGAANIKGIAENRRFITPINLSQIPALFIKRHMPINVALVQVSPPDDFGWLSLGISVDITLSAALSADLLIAQINPKMPRVLGQSSIHVNDVHAIVEYEEDLVSVELRSPSEEAIQIGKNLARLVNDGSTLQMGLDSVSRGVAQALIDKNDLGVHSHYLTDDIMHLYAQGVINNRKKGFNDGKLVASAAVGTLNLYEFVHDNPAVDFHPSNYVSDPFVVSRNNQMISINTAKSIDLTGQVAIEASSASRYSGVSGTLDFLRGSRQSIGGKAILTLFSTSLDQQRSNIVPIIEDPVVIPRGDVQYVVTEFGVINLFGKSLQERAMALISIAHPKFRQQLFDIAKEQGLIDSDRILGSGARGIYPVWLEEKIQIGDEEITLRPAKPVDERRIQEHFYNLDKKDIFARFFHEKTSFGQKEIASKSQIDYEKVLTLVAVTGEVGFGKIVALGESTLVAGENMAEIAFSVDKNYQGKGLAKMILRKIAKSAKDHQIAGLIAYTSPYNQAMIKLFQSLPYHVELKEDDGEISMRCYFDQPLDPIKK